MVLSDRGKRILKEVEAARILGVSERTLQGWRLRGGNTPAFIKLGTNGRVRYRVSDLDAWLQANTRRSTSDPGTMGAGRAAI